MPYSIGFALLYLTDNTIEVFLQCALACSFVWFRVQSCDIAFECALAKSLAIDIENVNAAEIPDLLLLFLSKYSASLRSLAVAELCCTCRKAAPLVFHHSILLPSKY